MAKALSGTLLDRKLLEASVAGLTGEEMAERFGIDAGEALLRVRNMLSSTRSAFDEFEQRQLLILSLKDMLSDIKKSGVDVTNPKHIEAVTKLTLAIDRVAGNQAKISEEMLNTVSEAQARKLLTMLESAWQPVRQLLLDDYDQIIDVDEVERTFHEGLRKAAQESA